MALNDDAVVTAALGYVFTAPVGTAPPTPAELDVLNAAIFGAKVLTIKSTGTPTSYTLTVGAATTSSLAAAATPAVVQAALEALATVGAGNVLVSGISVLDTDGLDVAIVGTRQGTSLTITGTGSGGTTPTIVVTTKTALNGWINTGHTSRNDMPEFGFDGGDSEVKGTWQNSKLREVVTKVEADFVKMTLEQIDANSFNLYYGTNSSAVSGVFGVSGDVSVPNEKSFLVIIVDGTTNIGFYVRKASVKKDDSIKLPVDDFAGFPIKATFLKDGLNDLFHWISLDLFA